MRLLEKTQRTRGRKEPVMKIIGCDYHPSFQQIAMVDRDTGVSSSGSCTPESAASAGTFGKADRCTGPGGEDGSGAAVGSAVARRRQAAARADDASGSGSGGGL